MAHGPSSEHSASIDFGEEVARLREHARSEDGRYRSLAERLIAPGDRVCVDVGCGAAGMALALASALPEARVFAVDAEPAILELAAERAAESGLAITTAIVDLDDPDALPRALGAPADLVWAKGVVHHSADQQATLNALAGVLAPGGRLAVGEGGIAAQFLPWDVGVGRPGLELRLLEAGSRRMEAERAEHGAIQMPYGWNVALERAGLTEVRALHDAVAEPAPLEGAALDSALHAIGSRVHWMERFLDAEDQAAWETLLDPESPHWLGSRRDLGRLEFLSVYVGTRP